MNLKSLIMATIVAIGISSSASAHEVGIWELCTGDVYSSVSHPGWRGPSKIGMFHAPHYAVRCMIGRAPLCMRKH
jgi:hypothetical protein